MADVKRQGTDVTIISWGWLFPKSLRAAEQLAKEGISAEVIDLRTLSPLDEETIIKSVEKTGKLIIVQEAQKRCGLGAEIAAVVAERAVEVLEKPVRRICPPPIPIPYGPAEMEHYAPKEEDIVKVAKEMLNA